jgi:glucose/arabinose dehydrogenase
MSFVSLPALADLHLDQIKLPPGFKISVYQEKLKNARSMTYGKNGTLFVGTRQEGKVYAITSGHKVHEIAKDLDNPNGVAFQNGALYVAEISRILKFPDIEAHLDAVPKPEVIYSELPKEGHHGWKFIAFGPDGKLYIPIGAPCNLCDKGDPFASINRMDADGTHFENFARGIRNTVGFAWHPVTKELWFTENGRDLLGDDVPADELNHAPKAGMHFGYPYCHEGSILDPEFGKGKACKDYTAPVEKLGAHVAALGMRFYTGTMFPKEYQNQVFIAEHGSWNRSHKVGYQIVRVKLDEKGKALSKEVFASGWLQGEKAWGRPVDVQVAPDGALLVSDDEGDAIYRISYGK